MVLEEEGGWWGDAGVSGGPQIPAAQRGGCPCQEGRRGSKVALKGSVKLLGNSTTLRMGNWGLLKLVFI